MGQAITQRKTSTQRLEQASKKELWDLCWVREPQQDRSARTRSKLLDAAQDIINEEGPDALTIGAIAKRAEVSAGLLYHYFQDRQTIIYAVIDRFTTEMTQTAEKGLDPSLWEGVPLLEVLEGYLRFWLKLHRRFPGVLRAVTFFGMQDSNIDAQFEATRKKAAKTVMTLIRPRFDEINHPDPNVAVTMVLEMFRLMMIRRAFGQRPGGYRTLPNQSDEAFIAEMKLMAESYLEI